MPHTSFSNRLILAVTLVMSILIVSACHERPKQEEKAGGRFVVKEFDPLVNWKVVEEQSGNDSRKAIVLDYTGAISDGFTIPTLNQVGDGQFEFEFYLKTTEGQSRTFFYKIYYQNESYKYPEADDQDSARQNLYAEENFYGSWEDTGKGFAETQKIEADDDYHKITGRFRIVGNPRNERRYFDGQENRRWKRNPRVGTYSFLLVVTEKEMLGPDGIPDEVQDISKSAGTGFINPYFFFLYGKGKNLSNTVSVKASSTLKVSAKPDPGAGIYIANAIFKPGENTGHYCKSCGASEELNKTAAFEQFGHYIDPGTKFSNIPVIMDVLQDNYSKKDYNWNRTFFHKEELITTIPAVSSRPCQTVAADPLQHSITIKNPGTSYGNWVKENVGVITRHGFVYGKWTLKAKLTELLNPNGLWNGLTNAVWLISQSQETWNARRNCNKEGYMANYYGGQQDQRVPSVGYSEIDFEILKTVPYCPSYLLPPAYVQRTADRSELRNWNVPFPEEIVENDANIMVCCTNWDMACWEPANFAEGCQTISFDGKTFWAHRWDKNYRAITEKTPEPDDELFGSDYYYFQIDWQPTCIIWRIGPSKDKLRVVGYVDQTITSIPNNQMLMVITQEFHNTKWWIGSPYEQDNIPFPKNDIPGTIYELTIE